jgi:membrane protein
MVGRFLLCVGRHAWIVGHGFRENRLAPQAASLTYAALLALVPFLLIAFVVARRMNMHAMLHQAAAEMFGAHLPDPVDTFMRSAVKLVEETDTVPLGVAGLLILLLSVLHLMRTIHLSLNRIWRVHRRQFSWLQLIGYVTTAIIGPLALLTAAWIPLLFKGLLLADWVRNHFGGLAVFVEPIGQLAFVAAAFTAIYRFVPSCNVRWWPAAFGGIVAGALWVAWQYLCAFLQGEVSSYNAIYGAFAALPVVLIWMYANWVILLVGAELSFAQQHHRSYDPNSERIRPASLEAVLLASAGIEAIASDQIAGRDFDPSAFAATYGVPEGLLCEILDQLVTSGLLHHGPSGYRTTEVDQPPTLADVNRSIYSMTPSGMPFSHRMPERLRATFEDARNAYLEQLERREVGTLKDEIE